MKQYIRSRTTFSIFYKSDDHFYENCTSYGTWFVRMNHLLKVLSPYRRIPCICYTLCPQLVFLSIFIDNAQNCLRCAMSMKGIIKIQYLGFFHCLNTCSCALCIVDFCQGSPKMQSSCLELQGSNVSFLLSHTIQFFLSS